MTSRNTLTGVTSEAHDTRVTTTPNPMTAALAAEITPYDGDRWSVKITRGGKFVSATVHDTQAKAQAFAAKKKAVVR